jgi:hypothetical protein
MKMTHYELLTHFGQGMEFYPFLYLIRLLNQFISTGKTLPISITEINLTIGVMKFKPYLKQSGPQLQILPPKFQDIIMDIIMLELQSLGDIKTTKITPPPKHPIYKVKHKVLHLSQRELLLSHQTQLSLAPDFYYLQKIFIN